MNELHKLKNKLRT